MNPKEHKKFYINGKEYDSIDQIPPEFRAFLEPVQTKGQRVENESNPDSSQIRPHKQTDNEKKNSNKLPMFLTLFGGMILGVLGFWAAQNQKLFLDLFK